MITLWFSLSYGAPYEIWSSLEGVSSPPTPLVALSDTQRKCNGGEPAFTAQSPSNTIPGWCPPDGWPGTQMRFAVTPSIPTDADPDRPNERQVSEAWLAPIGRQIMPLDTAWRASYFVGIGPGTDTQRLPEGYDTLPAEAWSWSSGTYFAILADSLEVPLGYLAAGATRCALLGSHGTLRFERPCYLPADTQSAELLVFSSQPWGHVDRPWWVVASVPIELPDPATTAVQAPASAPSQVPWLALLLLPLGFALGVSAGWFLRKPSASPDEPTEPEAPPPLAFPTPREPAPVEAAEPEPPAPDDGILAHTPEPAPSRPAISRLEADPYLLAQAQLLEKAPHFRMLAGWLARNDLVDAHETRVAELLDESRELLSRARAQRIPRGYLESWNSLLVDVDQKLQTLFLVRQSLNLILQDPGAARHSSPEVAAAWKLMLPHTDVKVSDKGAALASQLRVDLLRLSVGPAMGLAQFQYEGLPLELPAIAGTQNEELATMALQTASLAESLGYSYEHIALYGQRDADYMMDKMVTLTPIDRSELLHDLPGHERALAGVICRVIKPLFRPVAPEARPHRAQLLFLRDPS